MAKTMRKRSTRRPAMRKRRGMKRKGAVRRKTDYARLVEGAENQLVTGAGGVVADQFTTSLSQFQRAQEVAHAYKYYRCAKIELIFVPYANITTVGAAAAQRLPQLYFTVDRVANQFIVPTEAELIERGVSPKLFKKTLKYSWRPNLLQNVQLEAFQPADGGGNPLGIQALGAVNSIPIFNKWLPTQQSFGYDQVQQQIGNTMVQPATNPYALRYYGATWVIDQEGGAAGTAIGDLITKVTWEFKSPRALKTAEPLPQPTVSQATSSMMPGVNANSQPTNYP